ncbi:MAG TPA: phosphate propanoyltransferase [Eubacteriales bacterium]|nr:phosphate propanoyltransferase [Clostridia bacterium]HRV73843.1 phosphate propanoyltransferase [Eubacteriales bacterium]
MELSADQVRWTVETALLEQLAARGEFFVPVSSSNRHVHLSRQDCDKLFGVGYELSCLKPIRQPGQYACREQVTLKGPKGEMTLRVVGPLRVETQVELSVSDCIKLGIPKVLRMSGDTKGSPGAQIISKNASIMIDHGVIVAARHMHLTEEQGRLYGLENDDVVKLVVEGERALVFDNVIVRCGNKHMLEAHIDVEEANAAMLRPNAICRIIKQGGSPMQQTNGGTGRVYGNTPPAKDAPVWALAGVINERSTRGAMPEPKKKYLLTEAEVIEAYRNGAHSLDVCGKVVTPLAKDRAKQFGIELI